MKANDSEFEFAYTISQRANRPARAWSDDG